MATLDNLDWIKMNGAPETDYYNGLNGHGGGKANHNNGHHNTELEEYVDEDVDDLEPSKAENEVTKGRILELTSYSSRLEEVLLALLKDQQVLRDRICKERRERVRQVKDLEKKLDKEIGERVESDNCLAENFATKLDEVTENFDKKFEDLKEQKEKEKEVFVEKTEEIKEELIEKIDNCENVLTEKIAETEKSFNVAAAKLEAKIEESVAELKENLSSIDGDISEVLQQGQKDIEKLAADLKMGLEEEKLLRGQDIGILKFNITEGLKDAKDDMMKTQTDLEKVIDEEREDRYFVCL